MAANDSARPVAPLSMDVDKPSAIDMIRLEHSTNPFNFQISEIEFMRLQIKTLAIALVALGLAACDDVTVKDDNTASQDSSVSGAAISACLNAVASKTREDNVSLLSSEFSEANSLVMVGVGPQRAPWRCLVSNDGVVDGVSFDGEG